MRETKFDFFKYKALALSVSALVISAGLVSLVVKGGPNYGIDFSGGSLVQLQFEKPVVVQAVRDALRGTAHETAIIQRFGEENEVLVRSTGEVQEETDGEESAGDANAAAKEIEASLKNAFTDNPFQIRRVEMVGPQVGKDLRMSAVWAILATTAGLLIYITLRFEFSFGVAAIMALVHDTLVTVGVFSLLNKEFNLPIVAAVLTIIGYSLNDTIVIFDRVRENLRPMRTKSRAEILNRSINQTLSRTLLTALTVLVVVVALFAFGGPVIHDFAFALIVGTIAGTYSTVYIASPILLFWEARFGTKKGTKDGKTAADRTEAARA
ncbi:MAG: protein translocase subunit SecF [Candidatus Schekmanbacteria bacterium]|nr:protein translocase subunit SecF [Candidatus Schekmanbacteria bacterium]